MAVSMLGYSAIRQRRNSSSTSSPSATSTTSSSSSSSFSPLVAPCSPTSSSSHAVHFNLNPSITGNGLSLDLLLDAATLLESPLIKEGDYSAFSTIFGSDNNNGAISQYSGGEGNHIYSSMLFPPLYTQDIPSLGPPAIPLTCLDDGNNSNDSLFRAGQQHSSDIDVNADARADADMVTERVHTHTHTNKWQESDWQHAYAQVNAHHMDIGREFDMSFSIVAGFEKAEGVGTSDEDGQDSDHHESLGAEASIGPGHTSTLMTTVPTFPTPCTSPLVVDLRVLPDIATCASGTLDRGGQVKSTPVKRSQTALSCLRCRSTHKKCDEQRPCKRCVRVGRSDCTDAPPRGIKPLKGAKSSEEDEEA